MLWAHPLHPGLHRAYRLPGPIANIGRFDGCLILRRLKISCTASLPHPVVAIMRREKQAVFVTRGILGRMDPIPTDSWGKKETRSAQPRHVFSFPFLLIAPWCASQGAGSYGPRSAVIKVNERVNRASPPLRAGGLLLPRKRGHTAQMPICLLYTSDAADE